MASFDNGMDFDDMDWVEKDDLPLAQLQKLSIAPRTQENPTHSSGLQSLAPEIQVMIWELVLTQESRCINIERLNNPLHYDGRVILPHRRSHLKTTWRFEYNKISTPNTDAELAMQTCRLSRDIALRRFEALRFNPGSRPVYFNLAQDWLKIDAHESMTKPQLDQYFSERFRKNVRKVRLVYFIYREFRNFKMAVIPKFTGLEQVKVDGVSDMGTLPRGPPTRHGMQRVYTGEQIVDHLDSFTDHQLRSWAHFWQALGGTALENIDDIELWRQYPVSQGLRKFFNVCIRANPDFRVPETWIAKNFTYRAIQDDDPLEMDIDDEYLEGF